MRGRRLFVSRTRVRLALSLSLSLSRTSILINNPIYTFTLVVFHCIVSSLGLEGHGLQDELCKPSHYHNKEGFWNLFEILCLDWKEDKCQKFDKIFWQVFWNIIEISHTSLLLRYSKHWKKSGKKVYAKFLVIFRTCSGTFTTNIFETLQKYFSYDYKKSCLYISTIIPEKVSETFIEIFHASFLLRYSKRWTKSNR